MELTYDWRGFQDLYYPKKRQTQSEQKAVQPLYLLVEKGIVITAFTEQEDLSEWNGSPVEEVVGHFGHQECVLFDRASLDRWIKEAVALPHYYEQMAYVRAQALKEGKVVGRSGAKSKKTLKDLSEPAFREHFILQATRTWWKKLFPSEFGLFVRLEGSDSSDFLVIFRKGAPLAFFEPDLTGMGKERRQIPGEVVKFLSEKHLVPVQGLSVPKEVWEHWHQSSDPWRQVVRALRARSLKLLPFRWNLVSILSARAYLGL